MIGEPYVNDDGALVAKIQYIGWHSIYDEIQPVTDLVHIKGTYEKILIAF